MTRAFLAALLQRRPRYRVSTSGVPFLEHAPHPSSANQRNLLSFIVSMLPLQRLKIHRCKVRHVRPREVAILV